MPSTFQRPPHRHDLRRYPSSSTSSFSFCAFHRYLLFLSLCGMILTTWIRMTGYLLVAMEDDLSNNEIPIMISTKTISSTFLGEEGQGISKTFVKTDEDIKTMEEPHIGTMTTTMTTKNVTSEEMTTKKKEEDDKMVDSLLSLAELFPTQLTLSEGTESPMSSRRPKLSELASSMMIDETWLVQPKDFIYEYHKKRWDSAPIVLEDYKLIFFTIPKVACTIFKQLFRRMNHYEDWKSQDPMTMLPHDPETNGLTYLWDYNLSEANRMMTSPDYTRAIFIRDPKIRFLSAFLDKGLGNFGGFIGHKCCPDTNMCIEGAQRSDGFMNLIQNCSDSHWNPQSQRMESKFWPYVNFVGHLETISKDGPALLKKIGAWEDFAYGWGRDGTGTIFSSSSQEEQNHATKSSEKIWQWLSPSLEREIETYYQEDYDHPLFKFEIQNLTKYSWIKPYDKIYSWTTWDSAPVVVERYKLIFFTIPRIGAHTWKQAFRRMEGLQDWNSTSQGLPHDPEKNGLKYLYHYEVDIAEQMIQDPTWTKAIFIRHPLDRFLDIFWHMSRHPSDLFRQCCHAARVAGLCRTINFHNRKNNDDNNHTFHDLPNMTISDRSITDDLFHFLDFTAHCPSSHQWSSQSSRMEDRYWQYVNFISRIDESSFAFNDARRLLENIGAWEEIGATGWGPSGTDPIFFFDPSSTHNHNDDDGDDYTDTSPIVIGEDEKQTTMMIRDSLNEALTDEQQGLLNQRVYDLYRSDYDMEIFHFGK